MGERHVLQMRLHVVSEKESNIGRVTVLPMPFGSLESKLGVFGRLAVDGFWLSGTIVDVDEDLLNVFARGAK